MSLTRLSFFLAFSLTLGAGIALAQETKWKPEVDAAKIKTRIDYAGAEGASWARLQARKLESWQKHQNETDKYWRDYTEFNKAELRKLKAANREAYFDWLDAEKMDDWERKQKLEATVPALMQYKRAAKPKYEEYTKKKNASAKAHRAREGEAKRVYDEEQQALRAIEKTLPR